MQGPAQTFRRRLISLIALLSAAVAVCVFLAVVVTHYANDTLRQLANVELEAATLARQFRAAVDDLHGALLRLGIEAPEDSALTIEQRRKKLSEWLEARGKGARTDEERALLRRLSAETQSYFLKLDGLAARPEGLAQALDRNTVVVFDDSAIRLQSMADDFAAVHDVGLRDLLDASLRAVRWLRNLVFVCLVLLLSAIGVVVALLYRDVVRPLREQLVENETLLAKREKLAALGTLAAGVAHEIRNPLTAIKARLYTLKRAQSTPGGLEDAESIQQEVDRLERIVRDVLGYARPSEPALGEIELRAWLRDFAAFITPENPAQTIELSIDAPMPVWARVDLDQLRQIMLNLCRNAKESFNGRPGRIALALHRERSELRGVTGEVAVLSVIDDGPGIPPEIQSRLFDPFFTTKASGTGLGLSIVARLVENQGGEIAFQTARNAGTRFSVRLPVTETNPGRLVEQRI
jgi:signal transduction histidine kinase